MIVTCQKCGDNRETTDPASNLCDECRSTENDRGTEDPE